MLVLSSEPDCWQVAAWLTVGKWLPAWNDHVIIWNIMYLLSFFYVNNYIVNIDNYIYLSIYLSIYCMYICDNMKILSILMNILTLYTYYIYIYVYIYTADDPEAG